MNERIKELNLQAMSIVMNGNDPDGDIEQMYIPSEFTKKFAKLIVKECVRHFNEDYQRDFDTLWREDLSKSIREHFGIE